MRDLWFRLADFGQEYDLRNTQSLEESVRHSDVVYNLVGRNYPTKYASNKNKLEMSTHQ